MDHNGDALYELAKEIKRAFHHMAKNLRFDKTYTGIISSVNADGYTVKYNGTEITIKTIVVNALKKNDMVKFCVPCGNKNKAFIVVDLDLSMKIINLDVIAK